MAATAEIYIERAKRLDPLSRADELARAGTPPDEVAAALWCEGHALPPGYELPQLDRHALQGLAGRAYQRHSLYLHGMLDPRASEFIATNKLGYSRGPMDKEIGALAKSLSNLTDAQVAERVAEIARKFNIGPATTRVPYTKPVVQAQVAQLGPGTRPASGTDRGTEQDDSGDSI